MAIFNWERFKNSFIHAWRGFWEVWKKEQNFWIMVVLALVVIFLMIILEVSSVEKTILILAVAGVLTAEILNTAVEVLADKINLENQENVKLLTDIMAGYVLVWSISALVIGLFIFWPYFF